MPRGDVLNSPGVILCPRTWQTGKDRMPGERAQDTMGKGCNPRSQNGNLRRKNRARFRAMQAPCGICKGALGPIHYDEPSNSDHPLSFVIDEIHPVCMWKQYGYGSPREAAEDWNNLQAAHYLCNARKGGRAGKKIKIPLRPGKAAEIRTSGEW